MGLRWYGGSRLQVGPSGWHESPSAVWKDQDEPERAVATHPAQDRQGLTLKWMPPPNDRDLRREPLEVGSVTLIRSTTSTMQRYCASWAPFHDSAEPSEGGSRLASGTGWNSTPPNPALRKEAHFLRFLPTSLCTASNSTSARPSLERVSAIDNATRIGNRSWCATQTIVCHEG